MEICEALRIARNLSGRSQEYMAFELGVARKTVQNWESGISEPSIGQAIVWFKTVGTSPLPYLYQIMYEDMNGICSSDDISHLKKSLGTLLDQLPEEGIRQLLYLVYGNHGSSPRAILNMVTAHLQTPMRDRVINGSVVLKNYQLAAKKKQLTDVNHVQPNVELLEKAIAMGEDADVQNKKAYVLGDGLKN